MAAVFFNDAVTGTVISVANAAADLKWMKLVNTTASTAYLQIFDLQSGNVTLGTTVARWTIRLTANESLVIGGLPASGASLSLFDATLGPAVQGISIAGTTTATGLTGAAISVSALYE